MLTRRESKQIVDWVVQEFLKRRFPYVTDNKLDLSKSPVGTVSGTQTYGGSIANGAIWDRHINQNADIRGTKVRVATLSERGTVKLGTGGEAEVPTMSGLESTEENFGASLIGVHDAEGDFSGTDVEAVLHEIFEVIGAITFLDLIDTPDSYWNKYRQVPTVNEAEVGLEWRPVEYYDGGGINETYSGAVEVDRTAVDGGSATMDDILDGTPQVTTEHLLVPADGLGKNPVSPPAIDIYGICSALEFTVDNDKAYYKFHIPDNWVVGTDISIRIHWTRSSIGSDDSGKRVKWQIKYLVINGVNENVNSGESTLTIEDIYESSSTTEQIAYCTEAMIIPFSEIDPGDCATLELMAITPTGDELSNPACVGVSIIWTDFVRGG